MTSLAVLAVDPGTTTGAAVCVVAATGTIKQRLEQPPLLPVTHIIQGSYVEQARTLMRLWTGLRTSAANIGHRRQEGVAYIIAIEDFVLTRFESSEREGLDPVRVTAAFVTALETARPHYAADIVYQQPSEAKSYATNDRLRHWGLWAPGGSEHERDALRHMLLAITKYNSRPNGSKPKEGKGLSGLRYS